jgi:hypothetical protein
MRMMCAGYGSAPTRRPEAKRLPCGYSALSGNPEVKIRFGCIQRIGCVQRPFGPQWTEVPGIGGYVSRYTETCDADSAVNGAPAQSACLLSNVNPASRPIKSISAGQM